MRNPADLEKKDRPKVERKPVAFYDTDEAITALEALRPTRMYIPTLLGMVCGLRRGEICALRWRNMDLDGAQLSVVLSTEQTKAGCREKELKNSQCRTVALSAYAIQELRAHKARQAEELLRVGVRQTKDQHVVARGDGEPLQPRSVSHAWRRLRVTRLVDLKLLTLHGTRHSHASHLLAKNVHPKVVQERLGHSSVAVMDIYRHVMPNMQREAAERVDEALTEALQKRATGNNS